MAKVVLLLLLVSIPGLVATATSYMPESKTAPKEFTDPAFLQAELKRYSRVSW
jgi:hypothetical protein